MSIYCISLKYGNVTDEEEGNCMFLCINIWK